MNQKSLSSPARPVAAGFLAILLAVAAFSGIQKSMAADSEAKRPSPIPLPQENSDIPADPAVTWGLLDNGLRYAILPNSEPPKRVSLRLHVDAGSLMEKDDQQGLAHFLEHMAFNGTTHFPAGEMVEYFQRLGMAFGSHTNAHTGFNETVYKLEMPNTDPKLLEEGFQLLRDYADGMKLAQPEIDKERGVILSEKRSRDSVDWRTFVDQIEFVLPDNKVSRRLPIGIEEVIKNAPRERFVDFYHSWYTPDRMAVIVVGDVEVGAMEAMIQERFSSLAPLAEKKPQPDLSALAKRGLAAHFHPEPEAGKVSVSIDTLKPRVNPPDNSARRAHDLRLQLATHILSRRLDKIAKADDSILIEGSADFSDFFSLNFAEYGSVEASCKPENWEAALRVIERELRQALKYGFTASELKEAKATMQNKYEKAAKSMATRQSKDLANEISRRLGSRRIFTSPADDLPRVTAELEKTTAEEIRDLLRELWDGSQEILVMVTGNVEIEEPAKEKILAVYQESRETPVEPPALNAEKAFAYTRLPAAGEIVERNEIQDLEITQLRLSNNVRVNLKVTDFEDETVYIRARFGGGRLTEPAGKPGLSFFSGRVFTDGGLVEHDIDELKRLFAGKSVKTDFDVDDDAFTLTGQTTPDDLRDQLLLMRAYLTAPAFRNEAANPLKNGLDEIYQELESTPEGISQNEVKRFIHGGDPRFGFPEKEKMASLTMEDVRSWLSDPLASDYLEISVVGDFDKEKTIAELAAVFGSLPARAEQKPPYTEERKVAFPTDVTSKEFTFETTIPKGISTVYWPTEDIFDIKRSRRIGLLGAIMDDRLRLKLREELGDAYSPFAHNIPSDTFTDYGYLFAMVIVDPPQAGKVGEVIKEIGAALATGEISQDELERAKKPQVTEIEEYRRTNRYWLTSVLGPSQEYPERLEWARSFLDDYKAMTLEEVQKLAKEYLGGFEGLEVKIVPKE